MPSTWSQQRRRGACDENSIGATRLGTGRQPFDTFGPTTSDLEQVTLAEDDIAIEVVDPDRLSVC